MLEGAAQWPPISQWSAFLSSSAGNRAMIQPALSVTMAHALGQTALDRFRLPDQHRLPMGSIACHVTTGTVVFQ
jgi:hypothetical protein